jgi:hypothetical protein
VNNLRQNMKVMKYKIHKFEINMSRDQDRLEKFLNGLSGEVVSIIPNNAKMTFLQIYGVTQKINFLYIIEKLAK